MTRLRSLLTAAAVLLPTLAAAAPHFAVDRSIALGGLTKWDYLTYQQGGGRLFVSQGDRVDVIDTRTGRLAGTIAPTEGVHGIALAPALDRGFISAGTAGTVTMFDLRTLKIVKTIKVGPGPDAIAYDKATQRVFAPNEKNQTLIAMDARTGRVLKRIPFHADPEFIVTDGRGHAWLNLNSADQIAMVDTRRLAITRRIDVAPTCHGPVGLAIDRARDRLFVSCRNHAVDVIDARRGKVLATLPIPDFSDAMRFDPRRNLAFAPSIDGTLTVIGADGPRGYKVVQRVKTQPGARTMAFDQKGQTAFLSTASLVKTLPPTAGETHPTRVFAPGSFRVLVVKPQG
ncbi:MAG: YncE family protein [Acidiphilium sp.]